jgi:hypothetical protein
MRAVSGFAVSLLFAASCAAAADSPGAVRPPTLDPTYGMKASSGRSARTRRVGANAQWIWAASVGEKQATAARKAFSLDSSPKRATLYVTGDNYFTATLNGKALGGTTPQPGGYEWSTTHRYEVGPLLRTGKNVLAIEGRNDGGAAGIVAALVLGSGKNPREIVTDSGWKVSDAPPAGWESPDFDDSAWPSATVEAPLGEGPWTGLAEWPGLSDTDYLRRMTVFPVAVQDAAPRSGKLAGEETLTRAKGSALLVTLAPAGTPETDAPSLVVDFGKELTGRAEIVSGSNAPAAVSVSYGESREEAVGGPYTGVQRLNLPANGTAAGRDSAFRYVKIAFLSGPSPLRIKAIRCSHLYYPVEYRGSFASSDPLLNKIWYTGAYTAHLCMQQDIWDAPKRDRARWMGDLHVSGEVINNAFLDRFLMERTMDRLLSDAGNPLHSHVNGIPGYSCAWVAGAADFYRHTGDLAWIKKHHDDLIRLMDYFKGELDDRGLFANKRGQWPFVDWSPNFNGADPHALKATHFFMVYMLKQGAWLLREMGDPTTAARYEAWAKDATAAAQKYLLDGSANDFGDRWQENAMAIYSGVADDAQKAAIFDRVFSHLYPVELMITPYYNNYTIFAMAQSGHPKAALDFIRWYWGGMIDEGATSFWEGYDPRWPKKEFHKHLQADNGMGYFVSLSHGWSAGAASWLTEELLGVSPTAGGYRKARIQPYLGDLDWAKGDVPTPRGPIRVSYRKEGGQWHADVTLPAGTEAVVTLPGGRERKIGPGSHRI